MWMVRRIRARMTTTTTVILLRLHRRRALSPPTVSKTVSKKRKHHSAPTAGAIEEGSLCVGTLPDSYASPSETLAPQRRRRLELSVVKDNIAV